MNMNLKRKKPEPYKELRTALAKDMVIVALKRPENYEDVHPEIVINDAAIHSAFEPEHISVVAALLKERDMLREALADIEEGAPLTPPEWVESDNSGDIADYEAARAHYYYASIARAALDGDDEPPAQQPIINVVFRCEADGIVGTTSPQSIHSVSQEDDGSFTVELNYWPTPAQQPAQKPMTEEE